MEYNVDIRNIESFNPYQRAIMLDTDDAEVGKKPYLPVAERLIWFHKYCEDRNINLRSITTDVVENLTKNYLLTMRATVVIDTEAYTGYGSIIIDKIEGLSGDDIEIAETRAIGRALRNAGFGSPYDESDEKTPVDGAPPQKVTFEGAPLSSEAIINELLSEDEENTTVEQVKQEKQIELPLQPESESTIPNDASPADMSVEAQLIKALKVEYPFKPWPKRPTYELLELPELKKQLTWLANDYKGNASIKSWAVFVLRYVFSNNEAEKKVYLKVRESLRAEKLIK